jgi:hypothetical protein
MAYCGHSSRDVVELDSKISAYISELCCRIIFLDDCPIRSDDVRNRASENGFYLTERWKKNKIKMGSKMFRPR